MAGEARTGMPPFIICEGKSCSPDNIFISGEQELLIKINGEIESFERTKLLGLIVYVSLVILRLKVIKVRTREPHHIQMSS